MVVSLHHQQPTAIIATISVCLQLYQHTVTVLHEAYLTVQTHTGKQCAHC